MATDDRYKRTMRKALIPALIFVAGVGAGLGASQFLPPSAHHAEAVRREIEVARRNEVRRQREIRAAVIADMRRNRKAISAP